MTEGEEGKKKPFLFALKTTVGQEIPTAGLIMTRVRKLKLPVCAALVLPGLRGYVFLEVLGETEAEGRTVAERAKAGIKHSKELLRNPLPFSEIENFLTPKSPVAGIEVGDIVDIVAGPFKGERGRVTRIDKEKEEVTVELLEATVPIPLTISATWIKVTQKKSE
jgi:transcriptional antiterminator NusG